MFFRCFFFFFKQKTAYEIRISDWNSDVCSSDLLTAATLFPLYTGLASADHANRTAEAVRDGLLRPGGIATTQVSNGQQWDEPNGWAPLQWVAVEGLDRYGHTALAQQIGTRFLQQVHNLYRKEDKLRSEEHTSELQSLMRISYAVFCLNKKKQHNRY